MANNLLAKSYNLKNNLILLSLFKPLWGQRGVFTSIPIIGKKPKFIGLQRYLQTFNKSCKDYKFGITITPKLIQKLVGDEIKKIKNYNHLLRIACNGKTLSVSLRKRIKTQDSVIGFIKNYKRKDFIHKNLYYKKLLKFMGEIDYSRNEIILSRDNEITEGAVTNLIFVKADTLFIPKEGYYYGNTLKLLQDEIKFKFHKKKILLENLNEYSEIISIGSGRGIISINTITNIAWKRKSSKMFIKLKKGYKNMVNKNYYEI